MKGKVNNVTTYNGCYSEGSCGSNSPSPRRQQSFGISQCRRGIQKFSKVRSHCPWESLISGILLRWNIKFLLFLSLLYVSGLIICVGSFWVFMGQNNQPGAVYRSHELLEKLWPEIQADNSTTLPLSSVWKQRRKLKVVRTCNNSTARRTLIAEEEAIGSSGYLIVEANGGLNQQRSAICNAVALAGLLNAVLVIPYFEFNSVWKDPSQFADIYDQDHFISSLEHHVKVVEKLPDELMRRYDNNISNIRNFRVEAWAPAKYYMREVYYVLREEGVVRIFPFANRLAMSVPPNIQLLRCMANYKALRFSAPIVTLAQKLVNRMIEKSSNSGGKYVSVHLRFEEDMVAFSCCVYEGGYAEKHKMDAIREIGWKGKFKRKDRVIRPGLNRVDGKCPLTPLEVGMMLRGMGFDNNTSIYLASGPIYNAEKHLAPLQKMFPLLYSKDSLATPEELDPFWGYSSRLAALDYTVCLFSEVFVTTQGGNFPHFLMGHRRFLFDGHAKTIKPDKRKLVFLLQNMTISWEGFKNEVGAMLVESDREGMMVPRVRKINRKTSIYTYPLPECSCLQSQNSSLNLANTVNLLDTSPQDI